MASSLAIPTSIDFSSPDNASHFHQVAPMMNLALCVTLSSYISVGALHLSFMILFNVSSSLTILERNPLQDIIARFKQGVVIDAHLVLTLGFLLCNHLCNAIPLFI
jgi:hypothetical protein